MGLCLRQSGFVPGTSQAVLGTFPGSSQGQPDQKVNVYVPFSCPTKETLSRAAFRAKARQNPPKPINRAALKGKNLRDKRQSAVFCGFLRFSAVFCENQRFSAKICVSQMLCFPGKGENLQKSAKICENLRLGSVCPLRFVPLSAP